MNSITFTYNAVGNIISVTDGNGFATNYTYDKASRMVTVQFSGKTTKYTYDLNGRRSKAQYPGGVSETYTYDRNNRLTVLKNLAPDGNEISSYRYTYNEAGRLKTVETPGKSTVYQYDRAGNRLRDSEG